MPTDRDSRWRSLPAIEDAWVVPFRVDRPYEVTTNEWRRHLDSQLPARRLLRCAVDLCAIAGERLSA